MNIDTGHLIDLEKFGVKKLKGFKKVPKNLKDEANKELDGKKETYVDLKGGSRLALWAKKKRKIRKARKRLTKISRRNNR